MVRRRWLPILLLLVAIGFSIPARAEEGVRIDLQAKYATNFLTLPAGRSGAWGGGATWTYLFPRYGLGVSAGLFYVPGPAPDASLYDLSLAVSYHFLDISPDFHPYLSLGNDILIPGRVKPVPSIRLYNPTAGIGFHWFWGPGAGIQAQIGGRASLPDEPGGPVLLQMIYSVGLAFRF